MLYAIGIPINFQGIMETKDNNGKRKPVEALTNL
jgi:hypothetical protein